MKIKFYILCLLKFANDKIVFYEKELSSIYVEIYKSLYENSLLDNGTKSTRDGFTIYSLNTSKIDKLIDYENSGNIISARAGYYHHRVIITFTLKRSADFKLVREIRKKLKELSDGIIRDHIQSKINQLVYSNVIRPEAKCEFFYSYPLIVTEYTPKKNFKFHPPFSVQTTSMSFDIVEPAYIRPKERRHLARISIPAMLLMAEKKVGDKMIRDIINAIYQHCLYEKKLEDSTKDITKYENVLDETLLVKLWEHLIDTMGGKTSEVHTARMTHLTYFLTLFNFLVAMVALAFALLSR